MRKVTVFNQIMQLISRYDFKKVVDKYSGDRYSKHFSSWQQFIIMIYAQARGIKSLRDISISLLSQQRKWYHIGLTSAARSTLSDANSRRDSNIFQDIFYDFLSRCKKLAPKHKFKFKNPLYTIDSTLISLCLSMYPWAKFRRMKGALKIHTLLDHRGCLPSFITVTDGKCHDINIVKDEEYDFPDLMPDSIITVDRAYIDYKWLYSIQLKKAYFVTRAKDNINCIVLGQHKESKDKDVMSDDLISLYGHDQQKDYPANMRMIRFFDSKSGDILYFLTNNFKLSSKTIADIYKARWEIEIFFKWIKQNLKIKTFLGTSKNAVMTQIWIAMIYYLMLAFIKFQTKYSYSMHELGRIIGEILMDTVCLIETLRLDYKHYLKIKKKQAQLSLL